MRRRFFVNEVRSGLARIDGEEARHLTKVLRVSVGQRYEISDDRDVYLAEITEAHKGGVVFRAMQKVAVPPAPVRLTLCVALIKFDPLEWLIQKATELGVERIQPIIAIRSEHGLERAAHKRIERWQRIAMEASQQSRRVHLPVIEAPVKLREALGTVTGYRYVLDEGAVVDEEPDKEPIVAEPAIAASPSTPDGRIPLAAAIPSRRLATDEVALLVGPEGGWTDVERADFTQSDWTRVSMGPLILRAETAAIAALAVIGSAWIAEAPDR